MVNLTDHPNTVYKDGQEGRCLLEEQRPLKHRDNSSLLKYNNLSLL